MSLIGIQLLANYGVDSFAELDQFPDDGSVLFARKIKRAGAFSADDAIRPQKSGKRFETSVAAVVT